MKILGKNCDGKVSYMLICRVLLLIISYFSPLTSCGLKAVYNNQYQQIVDNPLNAIDIEPIESIDGVEFCHYLSNILPKSTTAKYLLKVKFSNINTPIIFQKNSDVFRKMIKQTIQYELFDLQTGEKLTSGKFRHISSYSTISSAYIVHTESERALEDLIKQGAEEVRTRLILYFNNNKNFIRSPF